MVRARSRALRIACEDGLAAALASGCSRTSIWRWQCAYARGGLAALVPERRGPTNPRITHAAWVEQVVIAVGLHTYWNAKRIAAELRRREIATVSHGWVEQLFADLGTARPSRARARGPRYERASPNSLWHIDIKGPFFIQLEPDRYHRLHGEIGWLTPGERFDGTPFTDRGFANIPALDHLVPWLEELRAAA